MKRHEETNVPAGIYARRGKVSPGKNLISDNAALRSAGHVCVTRRVTHRVTRRSSENCSMRASRPACIGLCPAPTRELARTRCNERQREGRRRGSLQWTVPPFSTHVYREITGKADICLAVKVHASMEGGRPPCEKIGGLKHRGPRRPAFHASGVLAKASMSVTWIPVSARGAQ